MVCISGACSGAISVIVAFGGVTSGVVGCCEGIPLVPGNFSTCNFVLSAMALPTALKGLLACSTVRLYVFLTASRGLLACSLIFFPIPLPKLYTLSELIGDGVLSALKHVIPF
jgi:hypothetical protein